MIQLQARSLLLKYIPDSKVHGANMGSIWGRQGPGGPHVGPMNFAMWDFNVFRVSYADKENYMKSWFDATIQ